MAEEVVGEDEEGCMRQREGWAERWRRRRRRRWTAREEVRESIFVRSRLASFRLKGRGWLRTLLTFLKKMKRKGERSGGNGNRKNAIEMWRWTLELNMARAQAVIRGAWTGDGR